MGPSISRERHHPVLVVAVLVLIALAAAEIRARADRLVLGDADDSPSRIDIKRVVQGHYFEYVLYRLDAYEQWKPADLDDGRIVFSFDMDADEAAERRAILEYTAGGGSQLRLRIVGHNGHRIGRGVLRRPSQRSVEVWIKRWQLGYPKRYRMFVTVETTASANCARGCKDRAPDDDTIRHRLHRLCFSREPTITGTRAGEVLRGTKRSDVIAGRGGNDVIAGVRKTDVVCGGDGDDVIRAGRGFLVLRGGGGSDRITATGPKPTPCDDTAACAYPEAIVLGDAGPDALEGGRHHEHLLGGRGTDLLRGKRGGDRLDGGQDHDVLRGGAGRDACIRGEELHSCTSRQR
jgi:Ca2+-binding RTX toxin-like protein